MKLTAPQERALQHARAVGQGTSVGVLVVRCSYPQTIDALERLGLVEGVSVFRTGHTGRLTELGKTERERVLRERSPE